MHTVEPRLGVVLNRMSPSAYLRGHGRAIGYTRELLPYLEERGAQVINGSGAFAIETSKVAQLRLLARLGLRAPRARVINDPTLALEAAEGFDFPVVVKPNVGGSGAGIQRFDSIAILAEAASARRLALGVDDTALVQEFLPARDGHIVRVEVLGVAAAGDRPRAGDCGRGWIRSRRRRIPGERSRWAGVLLRYQRAPPRRGLMPSL